MSCSWKAFGEYGHILFDIFYMGLISMLQQLHQVSGEAAAKQGYPPTSAFCCLRRHHAVHLSTRTSVRKTNQREKSFTSSRNVMCFLAGIHDHAMSRAITSSLVPTGDASTTCDTMSNHLRSASQPASCESLIVKRDVTACTRSASQSASQQQFSNPCGDARVDGRFGVDGPSRMLGHIRVCQSSAYLAYVGDC